MSWWVKKHPRMVFTNCNYKNHRFNMSGYLIIYYYWFFLFSLEFLCPPLKSACGVWRAKISLWCEISDFKIFFYFPPQNAALGMYRQGRTAPLLRHCINVYFKWSDDAWFCSLQQAKLLTFPTHSAFVLKTKMAKTTQRVTTFLTTIRSKLEPLKKKEMELLLQYKKEEVSYFTFFCSLASMSHQITLESNDQ